MYCCHIQDRVKGVWLGNLCPPPLPLTPWTNYYIDIKAKCSHLKKLTCKGTLRQVFIRLYRQEIQLVLYFQPSFVNCCPSNLLSGSTLPQSPPPSLLKVHILNTHILCRRGGVMGFWASDR